MSFGIKKCATLVVKLISFVLIRDYSDPVFYLGMYAIPKVSLLYLTRYAIKRFLIIKNQYWLLCTIKKINSFMIASVFLKIFSNCIKCFLLLFNKIWDGDFSYEWN